jgi:hypothetical protein
MVVLRATPSWDGSDAPRRNRMERKDVRARFYSPKAIPRKERGDWVERFDFGIFGKGRSNSGLGRKKVPDARGPLVSETKDGPTRQ